MGGGCEGGGLGWGNSGVPQRGEARVQEFFQEGGGVYKKWGGGEEAGGVPGLMGWVGQQQDVGQKIESIV